MASVVNGIQCYIAYCMIDSPYLYRHFIYVCNQNIKYINISIYIYVFLSLMMFPPPDCQNSCPFPWSQCSHKESKKPAVLKAFQGEPFIAKDI